jgi:hypothetical protein
MTNQPGQDPPAQPSDDDATPGEFIDEPENLPGDQDDSPPAQPLPGKS